MIARRLALAWLLALLFAGTVHGQAVDSTTVVDRARHVVRVLASPEMGGRGYLDGGDARAGAFLEKQFREAGLEPVGDSFRHPFSLETVVFPETPRLAVNGRPLLPGRDMLPSRASATERSAEPLPAVELAPLQRPLPDLKGKVAVVDRRLPDSLQGADALTEAERVAALSAAGAEAVLFRVENLLYAPSWYRAALPVFYVREGRLADEVHRVSFGVQAEAKGVEAFNVVAQVRGTERPETVVLVGAHYDHLGRLGPDVYFPGANDNAGGTAMLLELARAVAADPLPVTVVFAAFSGEELGLLGSKAFIEQQTVPTEDLAFVLNLDVVTSGEGGVVAGTNDASRAAYEHLAGLSAGARYALHRSGLRPNGDHYLFMRAGVPGVFLYARGGLQPYHHVDDLPETLEWGDFWQIYDLALRFLKSYPF